MFDLLKLAIPISLSSIISLMAVLVNMKIIGDLSSDNLYILTLFMPLNFWVVSLFESLRVPATSVAALSIREGKPHLASSHLGTLLMVMMLGVGVPFLIVIFVKPINFPEFTVFTAYMLPASMMLAAFSIITSIFNGIGKARFSLNLTFTGVFLSTFLNYLFSQKTHLGILSMPVSSILTYICLLLFSITVLYKACFLKMNAFKQTFSKNNFTTIKKLALPVFITYMMITCGTFIFNYLLLPYGHDVLAGFGVACRIQTLLLLPAISMGVAIGILCNKTGKSHRELFLKGIFICTIFYSVTTFFIHYYAGYLVSFVTKNNEVMMSAIHYLKIVSLSYLGLASFLCFSVSLEQIGYGLLGTGLTITTSIFEILIALVGFSQWKSADVLYWAVVIGNILSGLTIFFFKPIGVKQCKP